MKRQCVYLIVIVILASCGMTIQRGGVKDSNVEQVVEQKKVPVNYRNIKDNSTYTNLFNRGKAQMEARSFSSAKQIFEQYLKNNPNGEFSDRARIYLGQIALMNGASQEAEKHLREVVLMNPPSPYRGTAQHYLARSLHAQGKNQEAVEIISRARLDEFYFKSEEKDFFSFWGRIAEATGQYFDATLAYLKTLGYANNPQEASTLKQKISELIRGYLKAPEIEYLLKKYNDPEFPTAILRLKYAEQMLLQGDNFSAKTQLDFIYRSYKPETLYYQEAKKLESHFSFSSETKRAGFSQEKVGALLSFTGKSAAYGNNIREGLDLAMQGNPNSLQIIYRDPGNDVQSAVNATEYLIRNEGAMVILGPVNGDQAEQAALVASQYGVPFISLSPRGGLSEKSPFIFEFSLDPEKQVRALVDFAYKELSARRFAIIFPEDNFGQSYAESYFQSVKEKGAMVTAAESYLPNQVDFRPHIENMVGTAFTHFRKEEWDELLKKAEEKKGKKLTSRETRDLSLPPIVDFDVLFIPDTYRALGQIAPSLAYAEVDVPLLGPATWNNTNTLRRAGQYLEGAYFVDVFSRLDKQQETYRFLNLFKERFNKTPGPLAALGFDLGNVLNRAYHSPSPVRDRKELQNRLMTLGTYSGVLGVHYWNQKREALAELKLFQIKKSSFNFVKSIRVN